MGQTQSTQHTPPAGSQASPVQEGVGTKLFKFDRSAQGWDVETANADPHFYDVNEDTDSEPTKWYLEVGSVEIEVADSFSFEPKQRRVTFVAPDGVYALKFATKQKYEAFLHEYNDKLFQNTYGLENDEKTRKKLFGDDSIITLGGETADSRQQWVEDMDIEDKPHPEEKNYRDKGAIDRDVIHGVKLGASDRSYLVRNKQIDVLRNVHGGVQDTGLSFNVTPPHGGSFTPNKLLLSHRERKMNMLSPDRNTSLYHTDIETQKVINEWNFQKDGVDVPMKDIISEAKGAELDDRDTFLGLGTNRLVRWDMRTARGVVEDMGSPSVLAYQGGKDYARNTNFSCMATSGQGYTAVGADDGKIRLYSDKSLSRASTSIPGLGAAITAVDVTYDGHWVLATTNNYLMIVKTTFKDKGGRETDGFKSRMGAQAPAPRLLRLRPEDRALVANAPLQKGKFTWVTEANRQERWIVASCGNYTVLWNFRQVKLADGETTSYGGLTTCTTYHLIPKSDAVVDSLFMHDNYSTSPMNTESSMVVVTKNKVWSLANEDDN